MLYQKFVSIGIELIYTIVITLFCLLIYLRTHEVYNLTKYRGIMYFRNAFLFFGLAYLTRFILYLQFMSIFSLGGRGIARAWHPALLAIIGYFSTMAIFYLVYSTIWKKIDKGHFEMAANILAVVISIFAILSRSHSILVVLQFALLVFVLVYSFFKKTEKKHLSLWIMYVLVFVFWLLNLFLVQPGGFKHIRTPGAQIISHIISAIVFALIFYKVQKWTR